MLKKTNLYLLLLAAITLVGCHSKKTATVEEETEYSYPMSIIGDTITTNISDNETLYPISDEFKESFMEKAGNYLGHKVAVDVDFPTDWGVLCLERLPNGREMLLMQSKSREWKYLVITSGYGTQRILDLMPIAVNVAVQQNDILETEKWKTYRKPDGSFLINKKYEWTRSVSKATKQEVMADPEKYHRKSAYVEQYFINDNGRIEATAEIDTLPDYKAIVFFYNRNEKPEMWDASMEMLQSYCEENNVMFEEIYQNYNQVVIRNYDLSFSLETDITPYTDGIICGMVMMKKGAEPKSINFGSVEYMQMEIKRYFKLNQANATVNL